MKIAKRRKRRYWTWREEPAVFVDLPGAAPLTPAQVDIIRRRAAHMLQAALDKPKTVGVGFPPTS